jgi:hypothetical protein
MGRRFLCLRRPTAATAAATTTNAGDVEEDRPLKRAFRTVGKRPCRNTRMRVDMIRVRVPIDVNAVLCADSTAFALATPLRVGELLSHAVLDALGPRAPQDKRERTIASTHAGLNAGAFILEIDGRIYEHCDDVAVVAGIATVRFYRRERSDAAA